MHFMSVLIICEIIFFFMLHSIYCATLPGDQQGNSASSFESLHKTHFIFGFSNLFSFPDHVNLGQVYPSIHSSLLHRTLLVCFTQRPLTAKYFTFCVLYFDLLT